MDDSELDAIEKRGRSLMYHPPYGDVWQANDDVIALIAALRSESVRASQLTDALTKVRRALRAVVDNAQPPDATRTATSGYIVDISVMLAAADAFDEGSAGVVSSTQPGNEMSAAEVDCKSAWHQARPIKRADRCPLCDERSDGKTDRPGEPRYAHHSSGLKWCEDCGVVIADEPAHTRFHAILGETARAVAMLLVAHIAPNVHDRYDVKDRFDAKRNENNWSAEAFAETIGAVAAVGSGSAAKEGLDGRERSA